MKRAARIYRGSAPIDYELEAAAQPDANGEWHIRFGENSIAAQCEEISAGVYSILVNGRSYEARVSSSADGNSGDSYVVLLGARQYQVELLDPRQWRRAGSHVALEGPQQIGAPMPGKIVKVLVTEGEQVERDQGLLVIEAMKMQNEVRAPRAGRVERIYVVEGRGVETGAALLRLA